MYKEREGRGEGGKEREREVAREIFGLPYHEQWQQALHAFQQLSLIHQLSLIPERERERERERKRERSDLMESECVHIAPKTITCALAARTLSKFSEEPAERERERERERT